MEYVNIVTNHCDLYSRKLMFIYGLVQKMENEVLSAPIPTSNTEEDSIDSRQFKVKDLDT